MDPITAGLVAGGIGLIGSQMTNQGNMDIAQMASAFNAQQSAEQRAWQERMRSTQYQTTVKDLEAAGLNPMLAYQQGGAGIPSGAVATAVQAAPRVNTLGEGVSKAMAASTNVADLALKKEQVSATNAQTEQMRTQALSNTANALETAERTNKYGPEIDVLKKTLEVQAAQIASLKAGASASSASAAKDVAATSGQLPQQQPWWYQKLENSATNASKNFIQNVKGWTNSTAEGYKKYQNFRESMLGGSK